jgi:hypothetical protein
MKKFPPKVKKFINSISWTYAKAMPDWPHFYIDRSKVDETLFEKLVEHIRQFGYQGSFYDKIFTYFDEDGLTYWTMGDPIDETTIVNRANKEDSYESRLKNGTLPKKQKGQNK